jgi:hypothetical protein
MGMKFELPQFPPRPGLAFAAGLAKRSWFALWSPPDHHHYHFLRQLDGSLPGVLLPIAGLSSLLHLLIQDSLYQGKLEDCPTHPDILDAGLALHLTQPSCKDS